MTYSSMVSLNTILCHLSEQPIQSIDQLVYLSNGEVERSSINFTLLAEKVGDELVLMVQLLDPETVSEDYVPLFKERIAEEFISQFHVRPLVFVLNNEQIE